jgi:halimadienyl-diphosphate synthase
MLPKKMISRYVTVAFSAEMAGPDGVDLLDVDHLQESDGSISYSPSATAFYALHVRPNDRAALEYLRRVAPEGKAPNVSTFDVFEQAWTFVNLSLRVG